MTQEEVTLTRARARAIAVRAQVLTARRPADLAAGWGARSTVPNAGHAPVMARLETAASERSGGTHT